MIDWFKRRGETGAAAAATNIPDEAYGYCTLGQLRAWR